MKPVLVVNSGSSSLKYQLISENRTIKGLIEEIGSDHARLRHDGHEETRAAKDHDDALAWMLEKLEFDELLAVGHRVVHGGTKYTGPTIVDDEVEAGIEELSPLAPLHNPVNLAGIRALRKLLPDVPQVAVFDTAFHATIPAVAATYALPLDLAETHGIRRYGFHGTSCQYVTRRANLDNLIICHLGNGASATAVRDGRSVDTSMGLSPLEGLVMGTRSGDLDPAVPFHLIRAGLDPAAIEDILTKKSGLRGLAGASDMRAVREKAANGDEDAERALDVYAYRIRKYIGAFLAVVPGVQALVFTAGVGENDWRLRAEVCGPLSHLGIELDEDANRAAVGVGEPTSIGTGPIQVLVIPTDEESEIASQAAAVV
ncbi:acetate/propionate family kinase [Cryptosporangium arvum]|uniref:Acetate kinase n=1 Tax=Cryptosporangium arvum DSM 44712 TaxID=927661 RepID=A0A010YYL5_9ACTN|nr:acetate kinase [Cryptosporangium arvum]EXG80293.1 acetate kinase [Cryptosporangium arvum DSM 44712]